MPGSLYDRLTAGFVWIAAFCLATGVFLSVTLLFRSLPPTEPVAVGLVTILRYAKLKDYAGFALFVVLVPALTIAVQPRLLCAAMVWRTLSERALFTLPWVLAPAFYLTTGKVGWVLLLPLALSLAAPRVPGLVRSRLWLREMFGAREHGWHAALFCASAGWLLFRYLVTGRRIAHIPTLFLEIVFVGLFLALTWAAVMLIARLGELEFGRPARETFRRVAFGSLVLSLLPLLAVAIVPLPRPRLFVAGAVVLAAVVALFVRPPSGRAVRNLAAYALLPLLIAVFSYASTAHLSQWVDLFHRGETVGPASDYLRGKVPYAGVMPLHGMLENGLLDAWLMTLFGRSLDVAVARTVILGALLGPALWLLGMAVFRSIPLALLSVAMGSWTTAENHRTFFQVAALALFWTALRDRNRLAAAAAGAIGGAALFYSYDIGLYTLAGALAAAGLLALAARRGGWEGLRPLRAAGWFLAGAVAGAAPFVAYLFARGVLDDFVAVSFVTIPGLIDAVWSLPFPDLVSTFRRDLTLRSLAELVLTEKLHLVISPVTIAVAAVYYLARWRRGRLEALDHALLVVGVFAAVAQRSALGRAEFRHQYFAAFVIGPMLVLLGMALVRMLREIWREGGESRRAFVVLMVVVAVPMLAVVLWIPELVDARLHYLTRYTARVQHTERDSRAEEVAWRIADVSTVVRTLTPPGQPIFDFSNQPAFYFFADRPNPTRFYQVPILSPPALQAEAIRDIERAGTKVILRRSPEGYDRFDGVTNDLRAQALAAYIDENYEFHRAVRGVEVWTRRPGARPRPPQAYLAAIRLPGPDELVEGGWGRMLFPAAGRVPGPGGALWQSDLTLHNPGRDPVSLTLRFAGGGRTADRKLTVAPHETMQFTDVVGRYFGFPGYAGTVWIEHREERPPVAVMKTADVAHGARASLHRPLTNADAAEARTARPELVIVGVPARTEGRRVNVGMVNVGRIPATFRLTAQTRLGLRAGRWIEQGVPEEEVWAVNDVEAVLGVPLDETMTIRIELIAGRGVAYATVISADGDAELIAATPAEKR